MMLHAVQVWPDLPGKEQQSRMCFSTSWPWGFKGVLLQWCASTAPGPWHMCSLLPLINHCFVDWIVAWLCSKCCSLLLIGAGHKVGDLACLGLQEAQQQLLSSEYTTPILQLSVATPGSLRCAPLMLLHCA